MTNTIRDLLISLASHMAYMQSQLEARHELDDPEDYYWYRESVLLRQKVTDALLADEPAVPEGREPAAVIIEPSDPELADAYWKAWHGHNGRTLFASHYAGLRAVLARWGHQPAPPADGEVAECTAELLQRQVPVPVPVSERPWEREGWCDADGRCWWGRAESDDWSADWTLATHEAVAEFCEFSPRTVCLPAHALPLPEVNND